MRSKHYIYEIFGRKIGATTDVKRRMKQQDAKEGEYRIIEEHTNAKICSIREIELQKEFNYPVDRIAYWKTLRWQKKSITLEANIKRATNTDYKDRLAKRNTDYSKIDYKAIGLQISIPVSQYNLENNFIQQFTSAYQAGVALGKINGSAIRQCCIGKQKTAYKYIWKYAG